jgi:hypothetical protein
LYVGIRYPELVERLAPTARRVQGTKRPALVAGADGDSVINARLARAAQIATSEVRWGGMITNTGRSHAKALDLESAFIALADRAIAA